MNVYPSDGEGSFSGTIDACYSHTLLDCEDDGSDLTGQITPAAGNSYYLVVPHNAQAEGSTGNRSLLIVRQREVAR